MSFRAMWKTAEEMLMDAENWKITRWCDVQTRRQCLSQGDDQVERVIRHWTMRRDDICYRLLPQAISYMNPAMSYQARLTLYKQSTQIDRDLLTGKWKRLIDLLESERDARSRTISWLQQQSDARSAVMRLRDAVLSEQVIGNRGSPTMPDDDVLLCLNIGDRHSYSITPEPIRRCDWGLYVARCKLTLMIVRRANLINDDLLFLICSSLDDIFHVRTRSDSVAMPILPGVQVRKCLFGERDHNADSS